MSGHPPEVRQEAERLWRGGETFRAIAKKLKLSLGTLSRWAAAWEPEGDPSRARATPDPPPNPPRDASRPDNVVAFHPPKKPKQKGAGKGKAKTGTRDGTRDGTRPAAPPKPQALATPRGGDDEAQPFVRPTRPPPLIGAARPPLSRALIDALAEELGRGNYRTIAERVVGLPPGTVKAWLHRSKRALTRLQESGAEPSPKEELELELLARILHAEAIVEADAVAQLQQIALRSPDQKLQLKATLELLARKFAVRWGDKKELTIEGGDKPLQHQHAHLHAALDAASTDSMLARMDLAFAPTEIVAAQLEADRDEDE